MAAPVNSPAAATPTPAPVAAPQTAPVVCADATSIAEAQQRSVKASSTGRRALKDAWQSEAAIYRVMAATNAVAEIETALTALAKDTKSKPGQVREQLNELSARLLAATQELRNAEQQARDSLFAVENAYVDAYGPPPELSRDAETYEGACAEGDAQSCVRHAHLLESGTSVAKDLSKATNDYFRACALGSGYACLRQGVLLTQNGDAAAARQPFEKGCDRDEPRACRWLARDLEVGRGGPADAARAGELNQRACVNDVPDACVALALQRIEGNGVTRNTDQAQTLLELACDAGDVFGCTHLGTLLHGGKGVPVDKSRAAQLFERACKGGDASACEMRAKTP